MKKVIKFVTKKKDVKQEDSRLIASEFKESKVDENLEKITEDNCSNYVVHYFGKDKNLTKLHKAAWHGNLEKVKSALKKTEIDAVDSRHRTPLHFAIVQGHPNIVWFLLENNAKITIYDDEGRTPLLKAIELGHKECISLLLERGANINEVDYLGNTGLHIASVKGYIDLIATLLNRGADTEVSNKAGEYVLHTAVKLENKELLNLLLNNKAGVDVLDREGRTPVMLAAKAGNLILVKSLIEFGAQLMVIDSHGKTAEDYAIHAGHKEIALLLKLFIAKKNQNFEIKTENNKLKNNLPKQGLLQEMNNIKSNEGDRPEKSETDSIFVPKENVSGGSNENTESRTKEKDIEPKFSDSHSVIPICQSPRSWDFIKADKIQKIPKSAELMVLVKNENSKSNFVETKRFNKNLKVSPKYVLSLDRRKKIKNNDVLAKRRYSWNEEEALKSFVRRNKTIKLVSGKAKRGDAWMHFTGTKSLPLNLYQTLLPTTRKINKELECYDKALKELADSNLIKENLEPYKYHSFPSSKIRNQNEKLGLKNIFSNKISFDRNFLPFLSFDSHTFSSFPNSNSSILLKNEKPSLKSSLGNPSKSPLPEFPFLQMKKQETVEKKKSDKLIDLRSENFVTSQGLQQNLWKKEVQVENNKIFEYDGDVTEVNKDKNQKPASFSPLGVIFKEIQRERELFEVDSPRWPEVNPIPKNHINLFANQNLENSFSTNSNNEFLKNFE